MFSSIGGRDGPSSVKAEPGGRNPGSVAAFGGQVSAGTPPEPRRPSNFIQNTHLNPSGLACSNKCLRRSECKYSSPQQKNLGNQVPESSSPDSAPSPAGYKVYGETTDDVVVWINKYPKVTLCDIAAKCDVSSDNCGYILPGDLKNKKMRCFKQEMEAGSRIWPSCSGHNKHDGEQGAEVKNSTSISSVQSGNSICQAQSLTEQHKHPEEGTDSEALKNPSKRLYNGWMDVDTTALTSVLKDKHRDEQEIRTGVLDQDHPENPGHGSGLIGYDICRDKRIKLGDGAECSRACSFVLRESGVISKPDLPGHPTETNMQHMSPDLFSESDEDNTDEPESFTCQRVKPYFRKLPGSCARTNMAWPFSNSQPSCKANASVPAFSGTSVGLSPRSTSDSITENQDMPTSSTGEKHNKLSDASMVKQVNSSRENRKVSYWVQTNRKTAELSVQSEGSVAHPYSNSVSFTGSGKHGKESAIETGSTFPFSCPETGSSTSTTIHPVLSLSAWETGSALSNFSDPFTHDAPRSLSGKLSSVPPSSFLSGKIINADPDQSLVSSISLRQDLNKNNECLLKRSPPMLEPFDASPFKTNRFLLCNITRDKHVDTESGEFLLPPVLSPVTSPYRRIVGRASFQSLSSSEHTEEVLSKDETPPEFYVPQVVKGDIETSRNFPEHPSKEVESVTANLSTPTDITAFKSMSSPSNAAVEGDGDEKKTLEDSDSEENSEHGKRSSDQVPLDPKIKTTVGSNVLTEGHSSPSSHDEEHASFSEEEEQRSVTDEGSSDYNTEGNEGEAGTAEEQQSAILDELTAYEQDILLLDVMQEDPELFKNLPEKSLLKLGPVRDTPPPKKNLTSTIKISAKTDRSPLVFEQRLTPVTIDFHDDAIDLTEKSESRPWRPQRSTMPTRNQNPCPVTAGRSRRVGQSDRNNNKIDGSLESNCGQPIQTVSFSHSTPLVTALGTGPCRKNSANGPDFRRLKSSDYCRQYFSESLSCGFKMCRFQHLPAEGDEKFCVDMVAKFTQNPACLQKAGAVFTGYYQNSPPGVYFSMPVLLSLLQALLKAGMVSNVFSVLRVSLAHNIVSGHEFLLAVFNYVRDKGLVSFIPELMQLTFKMANVGLELSLDCIDNVKNTPMFQQTAHQNAHVAFVGNHNSYSLSACTPSPEFLNLLHGIVEIELCAKQENWKRMGEVYRSICQSTQHPNQVERISGRIAIALLSESKDKVSLPFAAFTETVRQNESEESPVKSFVGRIGVSLMLRYYKNHHWTKGRRVVEVMSILKVDFTTLKSLFGNEDGASRCHLITVATELFLMSGSVEGALNTLREHNWFLSSCSWPCDPADLESRTNVLRCLAGKTSYRDTLEVLCNLPGVKEPSDLIDVSRYDPLFTSHLQVCVERQILPVASDTVDFMLCKKLAVDHSLLQTLLEKLGRQNQWLRAREVFRCSLSVGYYPGVSASPGLMALIVPCQLGEVEFALTLEMFVALNASAILPLSDSTTSSLSITLQRTQSCEGEYISAGNRLLSAACLPQPKLTIHYTAVNSSQEQVFMLEVSSARRWLRHNHLWASEMWTHRSKCLNPN
ncbi:hypothetical protein CRENBAI_008373 [Crenichthys baileyi]|uniref:Protein TOPAZ1 n=1 Tax=Crenichthys baileyi TaxID=28760 RepID=A0AAV9SJA8_9TELE